MIDSRCGLHCADCSWKESHGCGGCIETNGNPFHGECPVAVCCQDKGFVHCGECSDIPCELLTQYSYDKEHGDNGERIEQCKEWANMKNKMSAEKKKPIISQEDIMKLLNSCYQKSLDGIPLVSPSIEQLSNEYLEKHSTKEKAAKAMIKNQIVKCTTSGFITGFGGVITLPVTIPANIGSVLYVQMRMIGSCAYMAGFDLKSDQTQTFVYACLAGVSVNTLIKQFGIKLGVKITRNLIEKIPGKVLTKINQKVGFRFITKFGSKGMVNLGKMLPGVGAVVGGGLDLVETKIIGKRAYKWFLEGDFSNEEESINDAVIDVENLAKEKDKITFSEKASDAIATVAAGTVKLAQDTKNAGKGIASFAKQVSDKTKSKLEKKES